MLCGELGPEAVAEIGDEVARVRGNGVIVDLLRARLVDERDLAAFVEVDAAVVAERPLLDALQLVAARTFATPAAALA